jgi:hypothetical protein
VIHIIIEPSNHLHIQSTLIPNSLFNWIVSEKKRNLGTYEIAGAVSDQEAEEMIMLAVNLRKQVEEWLRENHPGLFSGKS